MTIDKLPASTILFLIIEGFIYGFATAAVLFEWLHTRKNNVKNPPNG